MRRVPVILFILAVLALIAAQPAWSATQTATSGQVSATYSFRTVTAKHQLPTYRNERLRITRAGAVAYDQPVVSTGLGGCGDTCAPGTTQGTSVLVQDLTGDGEPEVRLDLYTGGAHCCFIVQVFAYDTATATYVKTEHNFEDPGYQLKPIGPHGLPLFVSADDNFAYVFTDFADSGAPLQIVSFGAHGFGNVTRHYPALLKKNATTWLRLFGNHHANGEGFIAAWAADEDLLGHRALVKHTLATQQQRGHLNGPLVSGQRFVNKLNKLLHRLGYT